MKKKGLSKSKIFILVFFILGLTYYVFQFHSNNEKFEVTKQLLNDTNLNMYNILEQEDHIEFESKYLEYFSLIDKPSIYTQLLFSQLKGLVGYKNKNNYKSLNENPKMTFSYSVSEPILSSNSDIAIIQITEHCEMLCGECSVYIFEKKNGKWAIKEKVLIWIS